MPPKKSRGRLNAVSVCIAYSQYLQHCAENRRHFREWVIATVPDDEETKRLAVSMGATAIVPDGIEEEGAGFHAGFNKSPWINAGLDELRRRLRRVRNPDERWVVVVDADTLLPHDFSERIAHLLPKLDRRKLYGLTGRRVAETTQEFLALKQLGPWEKHLDQAATVIGYFNLFHLDHPRAAYPASDPKRVEHDDGRFYRRFGSRRSAFLPFSALHLGGISMNWSGRREEVQEAKALSATEDPWQLALTAGAGSGCALVLGLTKPAKLASLAGAFRKVLVVEQGMPLPDGTANPLIEADRALTRHRIEEAAKAFPNVVVLENSRSLPFEPSVIVLEAEPTYDVLIDVLTGELSALSRAVWVCGTHYGYPFFPKTTPAIELLLGTPQVFSQQGAWALQRRKPQPCGKEHRFGIALWVFRHCDTEAALVAVHALERKWRGPISVVEWQGETPSLRIACARGGHLYVNFERAARERGEKAFFDPATDLLRSMTEEFAFVAAWDFSPWDETVWIEPGSGFPDVEALRRAGVGKAFAGGTTGTAFVTKARRDFQSWWRRTFSLAVSPSGLLPAARRKALLRLGVPVEVECAPSPLSSESNQRRLLSASKICVHFPAETSVVTVVESPEDFETLQRNWSVIRWPEEMRKVIVFDGMEPQKKGVAGICETMAAPDIRSAHGRSEPSWIRAILAACNKLKTRRILYLDPCLNPRPGTQVFSRSGNSLLSSGGWAFSESGGAAVKVAKIGPPATLVDRAWFTTAFRQFIRQKAETSFEVFAMEVLSKRGTPPSVEDVMLSGWNP